jgi:selenocysteine lyase/cysteine desulfurase
VDQFALAGLHAAVETLRQRDGDADLSRGRQQIRRLRQTLQRIEGVRVIGPSQPERALPSLAFEVHGVPSAQIAAQLRQRHQLVLGSGRQCAPLAHQTLGSQDAGLLRLSVGVGQPEDEIDEAAERLVAALA